MARIIKAALLQTDWTGDKESMIVKHEDAAREAAAEGAQIICFQELFYGPYFCQVQDPEYYEYTEYIPDGPTTKRFQALAKELNMVMVLPMYEIEQPGMYYNTAAVIDADGTYLGKFRKQHIPQVKGFWEKFYFRPGNGGYPIFDTAVGKVGVYICYDRHFPEGWRILGLNGAEIVFNPSATHRGLSEYLWRLEQPAAAVANMYYVGAINRVGIEPLGENDFYGQSYFVDPRGAFVGDVGDAYKPELIVRDLDIDRSRRSATAGRSTATAAPTPTTRSSRADAMATTLIYGRHDRLGRRASRGRRARSTARRSSPSSPPGQAAAMGIVADRTVDATGKYVVPGGIDVHTHMQMPFGGTEASDTFETGTRAAAWGGVTTIVDFAVQNTGGSVQDGARRVARQGRRRVRHRLRLPPDHRRRRRGVAEGDDVPRRQRGHHQLQALHGLPGRALLRRRPDPAGDAERRRVRGDDHDARRERHRHRRARRPGARPRRDRPEVPLAHPARRARGGGHAPGDRSSPRSPATCRCTSCTCRPSTRSNEVAAAQHAGLQRVRRDVPAVPLPDARGPARRARLRGRQVGVLHAAAHQARSTTRPTSGRVCG